MRGCGRAVSSLTPVRSLSTGVRGQRRPCCRVTVRAVASKCLLKVDRPLLRCRLHRGSCFSRHALFGSMILRREVSCPREPCPSSWGAVRAGSVTEKSFHRGKQQHLVACSAGAERPRSAQGPRGGGGDAGWRGCRVEGLPGSQVLKGLGSVSRLSSPLLRRKHLGRRRRTGFIRKEVVLCPFTFTELDSVIRS